MWNFFDDRSYGVFTDCGQKWLYLNYFQTFKKHDILYGTIIANISNDTHQERYRRRFYYRLSKHIEQSEEPEMRSVQIREFEKAEKEEYERENKKVDPNEDRFKDLFT